jgi:hypothetical protein
MKLPNAEHERRPWRIHELVRDFTLEDVWALPMQGGPDDFQDLLDLTRTFDPSHAESAPTRFLWNLRDQLGVWFGIGEVSAPVDADQPGELAIPGTGETSLRGRVPADLRGSEAGYAFAALPFVPLYRTDREAAAEVSNATIHGVAHLSWVDLGGDRFEGRMAVYVKTRGVFGKAYMAAIKPFRYWIVYPALMRQMERAWATRPRGVAATP